MAREAREYRESISVLSDRNNVQASTGHAYLSLISTREASSTYSKHLAAAELLSGAPAVPHLGSGVVLPGAGHLESSRDASRAASHSVGRPGRAARPGRDSSEETAEPRTHAERVRPAEVRRRLGREEGCKEPPHVARDEADEAGQRVLGPTREVVDHDESKGVH